MELPASASAAGSPALNVPAIVASLVADAASPGALAPHLAPHADRHAEANGPAAGKRPPHATYAHVPPKIVILNIIAVVVPLIGFLATAALLWGRAFDLTQLAIFAGMYLVTGFGITVGYHRLFTHKAFETHALTRWLIGIAGSMAVEGPVRKWVATHRRHHQHSDSEEDPHSPHQHGDELVSSLRGLYHAHVGWLFVPDAPGLSKYVPDLIGDRAVRGLSRLFPLWVFLGLLIPAALGGLLTLSWYGALLGFLWGGLARVFLVHHVTWSINSVCHFWGYQSYNSHDESRNNVVMGFLGMGEGWHNNHHAFPTSARHGLRWWELDATYLLIKLLAATGLAWNVRTPSPARLAAKRT